MGAAGGATVIVLNYNGRDILQECFPSVAEACKAGGGRHDLILLDNASTDGSCEWVRDRFPWVQVVPLSQNRCLFALNEVVPQIRHEHFVFLNNDIAVEPDFLEPLLSHFRDPTVFAVSGRLLRLEDRVTPNFGRGSGFTCKLVFARGLLHVVQNPFSEAQLEEAMPTFLGAAYSAFSRRRFLELGGFEELLSPFYWEDVDLSYRAWKRGFTILYEPRSVMYHDHRSPTLRRLYGSDYIAFVLRRNQFLATWLNISDPVLIGHEAFFALGQLFKNVVLLRVRGAKPVAMALRMLPTVWRRRARRACSKGLSDAATLARIDGMCGARPEAEAGAPRAHGGDSGRT